MPSGEERKNVVVYQHIINHNIFIRVIYPYDKLYIVTLLILKDRFIPNYHLIYYTLQGALYGMHLNKSLSEINFKLN